jgi:hypothetical protein
VVTPTRTPHNVPPTLTGAATAGAVAESAHRLGQDPARLLVALHALGLAGAQHLRDDRVPVELQGRPDREEQPSVLAPAAGHARPLRFVELHHARRGEPEQPADLLRHLLEHATRRRVGGDQGCDPAQRRLLVSERALGLLGGHECSRGAPTLGRHRREQERRQGRGRDEQLCRQQAVGE